MQFHEVRFPVALSFGSVGGPERRTDIVSISNGFEERNAPWAHSRRRYDAGFGLRSLDDIELMLAFYEARMGQLYAFRWKDWSDFRSTKPSVEISPLDQLLGSGDGVTTTFQLIKTYQSGEQTYVRPITKPVATTVVCAVNGTAMQEGTDFGVDFTTGVVSFVTPPASDAEVTAGFEFDVPVRFDTDRIQTSVASFKAGEVPAIPVVEVRV